MPADLCRHSRGIAAALKRYARPSDDHAGFLRHIEQNPDDAQAYRAYADWHRDRGLNATADFILRAANLEDTRQHNWRVSTDRVGVPSDVPPDAERHLSMIHAGVAGGKPYRLELWQRSPDGRHARWHIGGLDESEALDWERRLSSDGAAVPLYRRRDPANPYVPYRVMYPRPRRSR